MARFLVIFAALCVFQVYGRASAPAEDHGLKDLAKEIQSMMTTLNTDFEKVTGFKETKEIKEFNKAVHEQFDDMVSKMTDALKSVHVEAKAHSGEATKAVQDLKHKFDEEVKRIQAEHPKETAEVKKATEHIEKFYNDMVTKTKAAADAISKDTSGLQDDLTKSLKHAGETLKSNLEHMQTEVKKFVSEHQKSH